MSSRTTLLSLLSGLAGAAALLAAPQVASAHPEVDRRGGQWEIMVGGAACMPGRVDCQQDGPDPLLGHTRPSFATGASLGWRPVRFFMFGGAYRFGMFDPDYEIAAGTPNYWVAYQHSAFFLLKPILPIWRIDLGLDLGPGFSRQVYRARNGDKDFSQGFAFLIGPSIDFWVARHVFLGAKVDFILNAHRTICEDRGGDRDCMRSETRHLAPVHQVLFGFHLGGTFGG
jgi:hypothetical protein